MHARAVLILLLPLATLDCSPLKSGEMDAPPDAAPPADGGSGAAGSLPTTGSAGAAGEMSQGGAGGSQMSANAGCPPSETVTGWACIGAGTFMMGSPLSEPTRENDEVLHRVTITRAFWLEETEVTQGEWQSLMGYNPSSFNGCGATCPVEQLTWYEGVAYANALSLKQGYPPCYQTPTGGTYDASAAMMMLKPQWPAGLACPGYRLPTEAEWEYAARAGTNTAFYTGPIEDPACTPVDPNLDKCGWYCGNSNSTTHSVGLKAPNAWGLYDMLGNVEEAVWDFYAPYAGDAIDPVGPASGDNKVVRGGTLDIPAHFSRAAYREYGLPECSDKTVGFRLARSQP